MPDSQNNGQRRAYYRVVYPLTARPKLKIDDSQFEVLDISEKGVRFILSDYHPVVGNQNVKATVTFYDGEIIFLEGQIIRMQNNEIALLLTKGVPYKRIVKEQQFLIKNYPEYRVQSR